MEVNVLRLCFAVLVAATSGVTVCKCGDEWRLPDSFHIMQDPIRSQVSKYTLKMNKDGKDYEEQVDVDTEKETETFHVPKTSPDDEAGDIIYDFKKNLTMVHLRATNSCFLSYSTDDVPKPAALVRLLGSKGGQVKMPRQQTEIKLKIVGTLEDRSQLTDAMADVCEKFPIYVVVEGEEDSTALVQVTKTLPGKRSKRNLWRWVCRLVCRYVCRKICNGWFCRTVCSYACSNVCTWVLTSLG